MNVKRLNGVLQAINPSLLLLFFALSSPILLSCTSNTPVSCRNPIISADARTAVIELNNRSPKRIVEERILLRTASAGNRMYLFSSDLRSGDTKRVVGKLVNRNRYDFKSQSHCEVDYVRFIDGITWEAPSPL